MSEKTDAKMPSFDVLGNQLKGMLAAEASNFVKDNTKAAAKLGEEAVRLIFQQEVVSALPGIVPIPDGSRLELIAAAEEALAVRSQNFQLVAKAEGEHADLARQVRQNASNVAGNVAKGVVTAIGGFALKFLLGL